MASTPSAASITVDQQPLGKNARSNPATYTKLFDEIRKLFAAQAGAKELGLNASSFSFNTDQGCCPACQGAGVIEITMHYLQSLFQSCPQCQGRRYQDSVLAVRYQGLAIDEILNLTIAQALEFFTAERKIIQSLENSIRSGFGVSHPGAAFFDSVRRRSAAGKTGFLYSGWQSRRIPVPAR